MTNSCINLILRVSSIWGSSICCVQVWWSLSWPTYFTGCLHSCLNSLTRGMGVLWCKFSDIFDWQNKYKIALPLFVMFIFFLFPTACGGWFLWGHHCHCAEVSCWGGSNSGFQKCCRCSSCGCCSYEEHASTGDFSYAWCNNEDDVTWWSWMYLGSLHVQVYLEEHKVDGAQPKTNSLKSCTITTY